MNNLNLTPLNVTPGNEGSLGAGDPFLSGDGHSAVSGNDDIVSVNSKSSTQGGNRAAKALFILFVCALLVGVLVWFGQKWVSDKKNSLHPTGQPKGESANLMNPERSVIGSSIKKIGAASGVSAPQVPGQKQEEVAPVVADGVRPLRNPSGGIILDGKGNAMGVDAAGQVVTVPAIQMAGGEKKPLPGSSGASANGQPEPKPSSRFGGLLFVDGAGASGSSLGVSPGAASAPSYADILRTVQAATGATGGVAPVPAPAGSATPYIGQPAQASGSSGASGNDRAGSVGSQLVSSATPVARAKRLSDQNLILPKGRQADCVLTGRIIDEVPGFTSCALTQNLYSDNGRVLLLERGSQLSGEYGTSTQLGTRRLFVTWNRVKTPDGIEVDLSSPGSDALGTSGLPGHLDNRWTERIGAALLLSFIKDVAVAVISNQQQNTTSSGTSVVVQQQQPGQNTIQGASSIADEVVRQTIKVRPTLTINEGDRISIYVARDLDFSPVYALRMASQSGAVRVK